MSWILNEDNAIRQRLSGITVPGLAEPVPAIHSVPEPEMADMTYPVILITRQSVLPAKDREHRRIVPIPYGPEGAALPQDGDRWGWYAGFPIPYNIDYQVSVLARLQQHQTYLAALLAKESRIPERGGSIYIPETDCEVSMDLVGGPTFISRTDSDKKRQFEVYYMVRVFSEMTPWDIERMTLPDLIAGTIKDLDNNRMISLFDVLASEVLSEENSD